MPITAEQIQIFYEISMAIGTTLDLTKMVKTTLSSYLRKLNCSAGSIIQVIENENNTVEYKTIYSIPRNIYSIENSKEIIDSFLKSLKNDTNKNLPLCYPISETESFHIMELKKFGFLFLVSGSKGFDNFILNSIEQLNVKFSESCIACVQNEALEKSESKYRHIFESITDAYIEIEPKSGVILEISPSIKEIIGYSRQELKGKNIEDFYVRTEDQKKIINMVSTQNSIIEFEIQMLSKNKQVKTVSFSISLARQKNKNKNKLVGTIRDITKNLQLEKEKNQLEEQYMQTQKLDSIGRLAGGVAHDLNNLLCPVIGFGEILLLDETLDVNHKNQVEQILQAGLRARDLVRQLLAFSRKQKLEYKSINLNDVINDFFTFLRRTIREDIHIEIITNPNIKLINADVRQIEQVILNLAINAADAMLEGGEIIIETSMVTLDKHYISLHSGVKPGEYVMLTVSDVGCGMDEKVIEHIFEPFYTTKGQMGTGLGLATVYGIIKQHGGDVWCYSELEKGTVFKVYLPIAKKITKNKIAKVEVNSNLEGFETILLIEDDKQVRDLTNTILELKGYKVLCSTNGKTALSIIENCSESIDLILTDVVMPEMNGQELFTRISKTHPEIKFLFMSGYTNNVITKQNLINDEFHYIQKPFSVNSLTTKVRELLDKQ